MLALLMRLSENLEQLFSNRNRFALMTDHLPVLYSSLWLSIVFLSRLGIPTSDAPIPTACSLNIFFTQNLICDS